MWSYSDIKGERYNLLMINQCHSTKQSNWTGIGRFIEFSVLSTVWEEFDIVPEENTAPI